MQSQYHAADCVRLEHLPMSCDPACDPCSGCPAKIVCRCLQVTEAALVEAINCRDLRTLRDVLQHTSAGDGCTCCHTEIRQILAQAACAPATCG